MPSWAHMKRMEANMFNDGWYLIDLETTGIRPTQDDIVAVRIAYMAAYEIVREDTILVKPGKPLTAEQKEMLGITNEIFSHAATLESVVKDLANPSHPAPIIAWDENYTIAFLEAAFHQCGKTFDRPYVALESLSALAFGSHLLRSPREICALDRMKTTAAVLCRTRSLLRFTMLHSLFLKLFSSEMSAPRDILISCSDLNMKNAIEKLLQDI